MIIWVYTNRYINLYKYLSLDANPAMEKSRIAGYMKRCSEFIYLHREHNVFLNLEEGNVMQAIEPARRVW